MSGRTRFECGDDFRGGATFPDINTQTDDFGILRQQGFRDSTGAGDVELKDAGAGL